MAEIKKDNQQEKYNIIKRICSVYNHISLSLVDIFQSKKDTNRIMPIPEKIRYIQRFQEGKVTANDIVDIINLPGYEMSGIYFTCKYLVQNHNYQLSDIEDLISIFRTADIDTSLIQAKRLCIGLMQEYQTTNNIIDIHTKIRLQVLIGDPIMKVVEDNFSKNIVKYKGSIPVIALYAGLQLLPFLQKHFNNQEWIFVDDDLHEIYTYKKGLQKLHDGEKILNNNLTIIDDTYWSGKSYKTIKNILLQHTQQSANIRGLFAIEKKG